MKKWIESYGGKVTPCMGVWIETVLLLGIFLLLGSLPVWECGLKHGDIATPTTSRRVTPVWECGLKPLSVQLPTPGPAVTPCMGVWIETYHLRR